MLDFIYTGSYAEGAEKDGRPELLQLHMDALVIADYYQVPELGEYARLRFLDAAEDKANWGNVKTAWPAIVETLYDDFPAPANKGLKQDILRVTWTNIHAFEGDAEFQPLLENVGAFAADLFHLSRSESKRTDLFRSTCTDCDKVLHNAGGVYSSQCGACKLRAKARKRRRIS
ncbi:BTB/POZdomainprotein [Macrophomina phaseolina MS6]|uniref:BTB/POZdomainprotein n=1 Tax=Macrophomina phaseolina (strain MS6) TaxID=1126212 RepID=K2RQX9_MACPH|nr:BTB/POZdomainprotein [Macrophomina phaseolina MS6]